MKPGDVICKDEHGKPIILAGEGWFQGIVCGTVGREESIAVAPLLGEMERLGITRLQLVKYDCGGFVPGTIDPLFLTAGVVDHKPSYGKLEGDQLYLDPNPHQTLLIQIVKDSERSHYSEEKNSLRFRRTDKKGTLIPLYVETRDANLLCITGD